MNKVAQLPPPPQKKKKKKKAKAAKVVNYSERLYTTFTVTCHFDGMFKRHV